MLKVFISTVLLIIVIGITSAQDYMGGGLDKYMDYARIDRSMTKPATYNDVQGTPFLYKDFTSGEIKLNTGTTYKGQLRYDIYADQIEFETSGGEIYSIKNPETVQMAILGDTKFNYFEPGKVKGIKGYYEVLVIGNYSLYEKYQIILKDPEAARPYVEAKPAKFVEKKSLYFIMNPSGDFTELTTKKDLLITGLDKNKLESFIKKNKINYNKKDDLIQFVEFLNK